MAIILSVEDNPINQMLVCQRMKLAGHQVIEANDGESALTLLEQQVEIDLILLDIGLPKMDGITLAQIVKSKPEYQQTPIVFLTAHATIDYKAKAEALNIEGFFTKPIDFKKLTEFINKLLAN